MATSENKKSYWRKNLQYLSILLGIWFITSYLFSIVFVEQLDKPEFWLWGISPEGIGTLGMVLNFIVATVVSAFTTPPPEGVQALVEDIRVP